MTQAPDKAMEIWRAALKAWHNPGMRLSSNEAAAQVIREALDAQEAENRRLREALKRIRLEARKNKPDPDAIWQTADAALSQYEDKAFLSPTSEDQPC